MSDAAAGSFAASAQLLPGSTRLLAPPHAGQPAPGDPTPADQIDKPTGYPHDQAGELLVNNLLQLINNQPITVSQIEPKLIVRQSCGFNRNT